MNLLAILLALCLEVVQSPVTSAGYAPSNSPGAAGDATVPALTPTQVDAAIAHGTANKDESTQGLHLRDAQARFAAYGGNQRANTPVYSQGFSLTLFTPTTWVRERAAIAARNNRVLTRADISDTDVLPLVRVLVYPDIPSYSNAGAAGSTSVRSVYIEDEASRVSIAPLVTEPFEMRLTDSATKARILPGYMGVTAVFDYEAVQTLRGGPEEGYFVRIVGTTGEIKRFKVKRKHYERMP